MRSIRKLGVVASLAFGIFSAGLSTASAAIIGPSDLRLQPLPTTSGETASGSNALDPLSLTPMAMVGNYAVPYLRQRDYNGIGESACAATSTAMILRYYYPNSRIDVREIYHAGLQVYGYDGPAKGYRNLSYANGYTTDPGSLAIPTGYSGFYTGGSFSGLRSNLVLRNYLQNIWQIGTNELTTIDQVYAALASGPLIGHVWGHGKTNVYGHYLVILGIDDRGTVSRTDDKIIVNDPYDKWFASDTAGNGKSIPYQDFFVSGALYGGKWFRDAIQLLPQDTPDQRLYTVVVDSGHNPTSGNAAVHRFELDNIEDFVGTTSVLTWWLWYGDGDWVYPKEAGHAARWTPSLPVPGCYEVSVNFRGDSTSSNVTYVIYDSGGVELARATVNEYRATPTWVQAVIAATVPLANGAYVRAINIPAYSNLDSVKFKYRGANCAAAPAPPATVSATDGTYSDRIRVTWSASSGATGYEVWRGTSSNSSTATGLATISTLSFDDIGTAAGTTYYYWLKAKSSAGTSGFSASDAGWRSASIPAAPTSVSATDGTYSDRVRVTWSASSGATGYEVWRGASSNSSTATGLATISTLSFDDMGTAAGTTYYYWLKAKSSAGTSGFSASNSGWRAKTYSASPSSASNGGGNLGATNLFTLTATIANGKIAYFSVKKTNGSSFSSTGTMSLKVGGYQAASFTRAQKPVSVGMSAISFDADDLSVYPANTYPKQYYVRYEIPGTTSYQWCGPITITIGN